VTDIADMTLRNVLWQSAQLRPQRTALAAVDGPSLTYGELLQRVQEVSRFLHERGVIAGDRVAILGENMITWGVAFFAVTSMGAVAVPILTDFHPPEIHHILRHAEAKAVFVSRRLIPKLEEAEVPTLGTMILLDDLTLIPPVNERARITEILDRGSREVARLKEAALKIAGRIHDTVRGDDLAAIIYTSGTTGHSKGVMLTHANIVADAISIPKIVAISYEDRMLSILPLAHTYECTLGLVTPILIGAAVYYLDRPPTAPVLLPALQKVRPTIMLSVPLVIEKIFKNKIHPELTRNALRRRLYSVPFLRKQLHAIAGKKLLATFGGKLRLFTIGGAPLAPDVEEFLREAKFPYAIGYGLTETAPLVAGSGPSKTRYRATGFPMPGTEIRIDHPDPVTGEGEIVIKGPTVMKGYYRDEERTRDVFTADGWFRSGDLGVYDKDGYLYIKGRLKNMILGANGKNIYPEEIEGIINEFDVVMESLVFQHENRLVAKIHLNYEELDRTLASLRMTEAQIRDHVRKLLDDLRAEVNRRLPKFARIHRVVEQREPFEKTPTQKIKRHLYLTH
jgi:long-chain acyl-CoA synthetase